MSDHFEVHVLYGPDRSDLVLECKRCGLVVDEPVTEFPGHLRGFLDRHCSCPLFPAQRVSSDEALTRDR